MHRRDSFADPDCYGYGNREPYSDGYGNPDGYGHADGDSHRYGDCDSHKYRNSDGYSHCNSNSDCARCLRLGGGPELADPGRLTGGDKCREHPLHVRRHPKRHSFSQRQLLQV
jgi:hypothetical protein